MAITIEIENHNNKLATDSFIHIAPFKKAIDRDSFFMVKDPDSGKEYECLFVDRVNGIALDEMPLVFCLQSHNCTRTELAEKFFPNLDPQTPMSINIFTKIRPK